MEREEFQKCCLAVEEGEEIYVESTARYQRGKVLFCRGGEFKVQVTGRRETWSPEESLEVGSSSESPHKNL